MEKSLVILIIILVLFTFSGVSYSLYIGYHHMNIHHGDDNKTIDEEETSESLLEKVNEQIISGIKKATAEGKYKCCINPGCTMCFLEANEWNNHQAGTCACDDLIAQGKDPCPQCKRGLIQDTGVSCEITSESCDENKVKI